MGLTLRNGHWYYRQSIPKDVQSFFAGRTDIALSLKTKVKKDAKLLAVSLEQKYLSAFILIRTGMLPPGQRVSIHPQIPLSASFLSPNQAAGNQQDRPQKLKAKESLRLTTLIDRYEQEKQHRWKLATKRDFKYMFAIMVKIIGNRDVIQIDRKQCTDCRDVLSGTTRSAIYTKKAYHPKTVNMFMTLLSSLFKWGVRCGYLTHNPAEGLLLTLATHVDEERKAFSCEDLKLITHHLHGEEPHRRWIPIIAMYTGMRLEEVCSLRPDSFIVTDTVKCIHLVEHAESSLKTKSSSRLIPLHDDLLAMGLWEYVLGKSLFPKDNLWGFRLSLGKYGRYYGSWFGRFLRKHITNDKKKVFHSFRHSFANILKQAGVAESIIAELMGHKNGSITTGRYGKRYNPHVLLSAIRELKFMDA